MKRNNKCKETILKAMAKNIYKTAERGAGRQSSFLTYESKIPVALKNKLK